jgi:DNA-binding LacI/PurR family transcriptional regulator
MAENFKYAQNQRGSKKLLDNAIVNDYNEICNHLFFSPSGDVLVRVRISDVAKRAGVSNATVSRVLANKPHVREEVRQRVLQAVEELGFQPSRVARSLRVQRSRIIGLIISDIQNPFFTSLVRAVEDVAYAHEYAVFLCNSDEDVDKEKLYIDLLMAERVAGVVISPTREQHSACQRLARAQIPLVTVDRRLTDLSVDTVLVDNVNASVELVSHLIEDGHRRIGAVLPFPAITSGRERRAGYEMALESHDIPVVPELIGTGAPKESVGYSLTMDLLDRPNRPTALFTGNNLLTVGALRAIHDLGMVIPDEIAIAAFDELDWMSLVKPNLTVAAQPTYELGRAAAQLLMERIDNPTRPAQEIMLKPEIKIRQSCAHHEHVGEPSG